MLRVDNRKTYSQFYMKDEPPSILLFITLLLFVPAYPVLLSYALEFDPSVLVHANN